MNNHFAIPVKNLKASVEFYKLLGFMSVVNFKKPEQELEGEVMEHPSGTRIELIFHPSNKNIKLPKIPEPLHLGLEVQNLESKIGELKKLGIKIVKPITKGVSVKCFAFIEDPSGFPIELAEYYS